MSIRWFKVFVFVSLGVFAGSVAWADNADPDTYAPPPPASSASAIDQTPWWLHGVFDIRFGQYSPAVDSSVSGAPFAKVFGNSFRADAGIGFDWTPLRIADIGVVGIGAIGTYYRASAYAQFLDGSGPSAETTSLDLITIAAVGSFRLEYLLHKTPVPLIAYGKLGPAVGLWWASNGLGVSHANGKIGEGSSYGLVADVGLGVCLNMFDPGTAARFRVEHNVTCTYVFFEWTNYWLDNFGAGSALNVSDSTWTTGVSFQF